MKRKDWKTCKHEFPGQHTTIRETSFNVAIGSKRICKLCGAVKKFIEEARN